MYIWFDEHTKQAKVEKRQAERKWLKDKSTVNKSNLKSKRKYLNKLCSEVKRKYYNGEVLSAENNSKELFKVANSLLNKPRSTSLPSHTAEKDLANKFGQFFSNKIARIRDGLTQNSHDSVDVDELKFQDFLCQGWNPSPKSQRRSS